MELKVYDVEINDEQEGVDKISLVHSPAFEKNFVHYGSEHSKYEVVDEEKRIVFGPIILADHNVLRNDPPLGWHYTRYSADTIQKIASKYFKEKHIDDVNIHHKTDVEGVYMIESFFKDSNRVVPILYQDAADGSWFGSFKVENDEVWKHVKDGTFRGYSIEIYHSYKDSGETIINNEINSNYGEMKTIQKLNRRKNFRKVYSASFGKSPQKINYDSVTTDKGELAVDGEFALEKEAMLFTSSDEPVVARDGQYTVTEGDLAGDVITVTGGVITEFSGSSENEETGGGESDTATETEIKAEAAAVEVLLDGVVEHIDAIVEKITTPDTVLMSRIDNMETKINSIYSLLEEKKGNKVKPDSSSKYENPEMTPEQTFFKNKNWK